MEFQENIYIFIEELRQYEHRIEGIDFVWDILFPDQKDKYHYLRVTKFHEVFYLAHIDGNLCSLEINQNKSVQAAPSLGWSSSDDGSHDPAKNWGSLITAVRKWLNFVKKDWIKANKQVQSSYPLRNRYGIVPNSPIRYSLPDIYRIDEELGKNKTKAFIDLVEQGYFHSRDIGIRKHMTASNYFDYCRIAYIAGERAEDNVDKTLSGRQMYERYADGRDEGLLSIDPNSEAEFADWIDGRHPRRSCGGHPWEIKRGGNTTHIDLSVSRPPLNGHEHFQVLLRGGSIGRLKETICMFLGLYEARLPIAINDPEGIRKRLLAQDNVGIVPYYHSLHRANQHFHKSDDVYDVLHFDDLGRFKRRIKPFITWEPLPIIKPNS